MKERFETFTVLINKISRNIRKIKNQKMAEYGLRSTHVSCLYYLYSAQTLTATELCERCEEDKATISRALVFLEDKGFILCQAKSVKRYKSPVFLTEKGREAGKKIFEAVDCVLDEVGVGLTDAQRKDFYTYLTVISNNLDNITDNLTQFPFLHTYAMEILFRQRYYPQKQLLRIVFEERDIEAFIEKLEKLYPSIEYVNRLMTHSWGNE